MWGGQLWHFTRYAQEFPSVLPLPLRTGVFRVVGCRQVSLLVLGCRQQSCFWPAHQKKKPFRGGRVEPILVISWHTGSRSWWTVPLGLCSWMDASLWGCAAISSSITVLGTKVPEDSPRDKAWVMWQPLVREGQGILTVSPKPHTMRAEDRSPRDTRMLFSSRALQLHPMLPVLREISSFKWSCFLLFPIIWAYPGDAFLLNWPDDYPMINVKVSRVWIFSHQERDLLGRFLGFP